MNEDITAREMTVIDEKGKQLGTKTLEEALEIAGDKKLDLILVGPKAKPYPIAKLMDYGKLEFEKAKRQKEARKKSKQTETKEIRLSPNIAEHDITYKSKNARDFIEKGNKVKVTMRFRGREIAKSDIGKDVMSKFAKTLEDVAEIVKKPSMEGRTMQMILAKKK